MSLKTKDKAADKTLIKRLYFYIRPYINHIILAIILSLVVAYLGTVRPKLTQMAVDDHIAIGDFEGLWGIIILLLLALVGEFILLMVNTYLTRWFGQNALYSLRSAVFSKIRNLHVQYFDKSPIGRLITRTTSDVEV